MSWSWTDSTADAIRILKDVRAGRLGPNVRASAGEFTLLTLAAAHKLLDEVEYLCEAGADVRASTKHIGGALLTAVASGQLEIVRCLVKHGAMVNEKGLWDTTPLITASGRGDLEMVKYLVKEGANVHAYDRDGFGPALTAAESKHFHVARYLVEQGADIDAMDDRDGYTLLMRACTAGDFAMVQFLVERGASLGYSNKYRETAMQMAAAGKHAAIVEFLRTGAKPRGPPEVISPVPTIQGLQAEVAALAAQLAERDAAIAELRVRLGVNGTAGLHANAPEVFEGVANGSAAGPRDTALEDLSVTCDGGPPEPLEVCHESDDIKDTENAYLRAQALKDEVLSTVKALPSAATDVARYKYQWALTDDGTVCIKETREELRAVAVFEAALLQPRTSALLKSFLTDDVPQFIALDPQLPEKAAAFTAPENIEAVCSMLWRAIEFSRSCNIEEKVCVGARALWRLSQIAKALAQALRADPRAAAAQLKHAVEGCHVYTSEMQAIIQALGLSSEVSYVPLPTI